MVAIEKGAFRSPLTKVSNLIFFNGFKYSNSIQIIFKNWTIWPIDGTLTSANTPGCYILICWFMQKYTFICWIHTDAINKDAGRKTQEAFFNNILPLTLLQGFERVVQGLHVRGSWRSNITAIFWPHCYDCHVVSFLFSWCWGPLHRGSRGPPRLGVAFPTTSRLQQSGILLVTDIIVRRPFNLWNWMFNRHQAEITVMQFRGHSLPVHPSVVYHGNYLIPFHQPISTHAISSPNCHWNVSLPSGASPWNSIFWAGLKVKTG